MSMAPAEVIYLETTQPDYFNGWPAHYYTTDPAGTSGDQKRQLLAAIAAEEVFLPNGEAAPEEFYAELVQSVEELFAQLDLRKHWHEGFTTADLRKGDGELMSHWGIMMNTWKEK